MMWRWAKAVAQFPNLTGFILSLILVGAFFGQSLEVIFFPVISNPAVTNVGWSNDGRINWTVDFCKVRPARLDAVSYTFFYKSAKGLAPGIPLIVKNETLSAPVGGFLYPPGCFKLRYSSAPPEDAAAGDIIVSDVWYRSFHPFWLLPQSLGTVTLPARPPEIAPKA